MGPPGLFLFTFGLFKQTIQFLQQSNVKKFPFSIWHWDSNPQPLDHELSPITTRPGLPPRYKHFTNVNYDTGIVPRNLQS